MWDFSNKTSPMLIESFQPFTVKDSHKKHHYNLELVNGLLFVSSDSSVKLLRNKIY
jgi:hypothetical protein